MTARAIVRIARGAAILLGLAVATPAWAQAPDDAGVPVPPAGDAAAAAPTFEPPRALAATDVPYPDGAPAHDAPIVVTVKLTIDPTGAVAALAPVTPPRPVFDDAVRAAALAFQFAPATFGGAPVPVELTFTHTFLPPPPPVLDAGPPRTSMLRGKLVQLGTRAPVSGATVTAQVAGRHYVAEADARGRFELPLPEGPARITVTAPGHLIYLQTESLGRAQAVAVTYLVERDRYDPYEIVVVSDHRREEVSRISLRGAEIQQIPGTFGDPFRVVQALPGVAAVVSLLPFPVVRGATPGATGFLLDGTRVPLLYHLLSGPSIIHPAFIDEVQVYPGGAPVTYGGYTGGIIDGRTVRARRDERLLDIDANLPQIGALVRQPIPALGATVTVAGRYGYPGALLRLAGSNTTLSYGDYQLRLDGGNARDGWTVFAFGARDELGNQPEPRDPADPAPPPPPPRPLVLELHRLDLRLHRTFGRLLATARAVVGYDRTASDGIDFTTLVAEPSVHLTWKLHPTWTLAGGVEGAVHQIRQGERMPGPDALSKLTAELDTFTIGGAQIEALWRPTPAWLIRPGVRADVYADPTATATAIDPRLTVRYRLAQRALADVPADSDDSAVWLKASAGVYHQPPRFVLPLPGLDMMPIKYGLLRSLQTSLGVEVPIRDRIQLTAEAYATAMDPTIFDLATNDELAGERAPTTLFPTRNVVPAPPDDQAIERLTRPQLGRSYGVEILLRRQARSGLFGWVSYTLSRSQRQRDGQWARYDYDRTHLINVVAGLPLGRNWDLGLRLQYQSGKPETVTGGYNAASGAGYARFDLRIDKRAVWQRWLLDFYIDLTNVALMPEEIEAGSTIRYVLPTLGVRGRF